MRENTPDAWVILRIASPEEGVVHKVLAGWYGGFAGSDSWRLNSGISRIEHKDGVYAIHGHSGSIYWCHENCQRMTGLMASRLQSWVQQFDGKATFEAIDISTILKDYP